VTVGVIVAPLSRVLLIYSEIGSYVRLSRLGCTLAQWIESQTTSSGQTKSNRITLLRNSDGKGGAETRSIFLDNLNSPFGCARSRRPMWADSDANSRSQYEQRWSTRR
jgi:glucose/arabinose dehydrogenase